jgi:hypothetical protein
MPKVLPGNSSISPDMTSVRPWMRVLLTGTPGLTTRTVGREVAPPVIVTVPSWMSRWMNSPSVRAPGGCRVVSVSRTTRVCRSVRSR